MLPAMRGSAQPVMNSADFPLNLGVQPPVQIIDHLEPGAAGANVTFDASSAVQATPTTSQLVLPSSTPYGSYYPTADYASAALTNPSQYGYQDVTASYRDNLGFYSPTSHVILTNPERIFSSPLSFNQQWSDPWSGTGDNSGTSFTRAGTTTGTYNGYGTLILPFGTFTDVIRLEMVETYSDVILGFTYNYDVNIVSYLKPGIPSALFSSTTLTIDLGFGNPQVTTYSTLIDPSVVGVAEFPDGGIAAMLYPNPASENATIALDHAAGSSLDVEVIDAMGRRVQHLGIGAGQQLIPLDVAGLENGSYTVRLSPADGEASVLRMMVQH